MNEAETRETLIAMERAALELWSKGDPSGYLKHTADDVTYFDHLAKARIDGAEELSQHCRQFEGTVDVPQWKMVNPQVRQEGDVAVLTFHWETYSGDGELTSRWNATEVFRLVQDRWQYVHMHWAINNFA